MFSESLVILFISARILAETDCRINVLKPNGKFRSYLFGFHWRAPTTNYNKTQETIENGETVEFYCDNGFIKDDFEEKNYTFECTNGKFNKTHYYEDLLCKSDYHKNTMTFPLSNVQFKSKILGCNGKGLDVYRVMSKQNDGSLRSLYTVCFDKNMMRTKFVQQIHIKNNSSETHKRGRDIWGFDYFGRNAEEKLKLSNGFIAKLQRSRLTNAFSHKYSRKRKYPYTFNRGHFAPYADFTDENDRKASCQYINVAPQWKVLNGNSWSLIESKTREIVQNNPSEWEIYTGAFGIIPTFRGPLFISPFFDDRGKFIKGFVPVPKLYWKVIYNTVNKNNSRVYLGVNNPELKSPEEFTDKYVICTPLSDTHGVIFRGSEHKGFTYECNIEEFLEKLKKEEKIVKV